MSRPLYVRVLRLRYVSPGGLLCFVYFEGAFGLGVLLALAELVTWWGVLVLPASIALMVKLNDLMAGVAAVRSATPRPAQGGAGDAVRRSLARRSAARAAGAVPAPEPLALEGGADDVYGAAVARGAADLHGAANSHAGLTGGHSDGALIEAARLSQNQPLPVVAARNARSRVDASQDQTLPAAAARAEAPRAAWSPDQATRVEGARDQALPVAAARSDRSRVDAPHDQGVRPAAPRAETGRAEAAQTVRPTRAGATRGAGGTRFAGQRVDSPGAVSRSGAVYRASGASAASENTPGMRGGRDSGSRDHGREPFEANGPGQALSRSASAGQAPIPAAHRDAVGSQRMPHDDMTWQNEEPHPFGVTGRGETSGYDDPARRPDTSANPPRRPGLPGGRRPNESHRLTPPPGRGTPPGRAPMTGGAPAARRAADAGTHRFPDRPTEFGGDRSTYRRPADGTVWQATTASGGGRRPAESTGRHDSDLRTDDRFDVTGHSDTPQQRARQSGTRRYE